MQNRPGGMGPRLRSLRLRSLPVPRCGFSWSPPYSWRWRPRFPFDTFDALFVHEFGHFAGLIAYADPRPQSTPAPVDDQSEQRLDQRVSLSPLWLPSRRVCTTWRKGACHEVLQSPGWVLLALFGSIGVGMAQDCLEAPAGMTGWWPGDGDATDIADGNDGMLWNGATFSSAEEGMVGQTFSLDGVDDYVQLPASASLT
jgi:hypothetical protein